jgi:hypothetical protein
MCVIRSRFKKNVKRLRCEEQRREEKRREVDGWKVGSYVCMYVYSSIGCSVGLGVSTP